MGWDSYCYGLDVQPHDINLLFQTEGLQITDAQQVTPTQSPTLQLWCLAQEQGLAVQCHSDHEGNCLRVPMAECNTFLELLQQAYPVVAVYWIQTLSVQFGACVTLPLAFSRRAPSSPSDLANAALSSVIPLCHLSLA